jgi:hypothetical protein
MRTTKGRAVLISGFLLECRKKELLWSLNLKLVCRQRTHQLQIEFS